MFGVRLLLNTSAMRRLATAAILLLVVCAVAAPKTTPARGEGASTVAVGSFENEAGAPSNVVNDLSRALYQAVASSGRYDVKGSGPLAARTTLTNDAFMEALGGAARAGASELLLGAVVQVSGGQVYYRLSLYRVKPVTFIGSQVFSQAYPPSDPRSLSAGLGSNVATLAAPRQALGTIYSTTDGVRADLGSSYGFVLGDRFNVMRGGLKVAEAEISSIRDDEATVTIRNASPGYQPKIGDTLVGLRALEPALPAPPTHTTFNPFGVLAAVGGVLLAIGHHGQPGNPCNCATPGPTPSNGGFTFVNSVEFGHPPTGFVEFTFSQLFNATSQTGVQGNISYASYTLLPPNSQATTQPAPLSSLGLVTFSAAGAGGLQQIVDVNLTQPGLVTGEGVTFFFTSLITDQAGAVLNPPPTIVGTLSVIGKPLPGPGGAAVGPVAPGPGKPIGPAPGVPPKVPPKAPPSNPKPPPGAPIPH